jgi:pimeloyl-ACP methyl ester carboxylesterase
MPYFSFDNNKIFYRVKGSGQPLLLIHGNSVSSKMFQTVLKLYSKSYRTVVFDFPGHGRSSRLEKFETDFWYYNSKAASALLNHIGIDSTNVIGTSGGALVGINLALEHPEQVNFLVADSFEGEYPLESYIRTIRVDRERDKKKWMAKLYWWYFHGWDWKRVVDMDTDVNVEFAKTGKSFFHKSIADLKVPTLLTGSLKDEYCDHLDEIYKDLGKKNKALEIHMFKEGKHPALISNKTAFMKIFSSHLEKINKI